MSSPKKEVKQSFEHTLKKLEQIVDELEQGEVPLDDALKMYEEGIALSRACIDRLAKAEVRLKKLSKDMKGSFHLVQDEEREEEG